MQIIYAAPFILMSIICFAVSLVVPGLRRFAVQALVAPAAFGFCSLATWLIFAFVCWGVLNAKSNSRYLLPIEGIAFYFLPGVLGSWLAVRIVRFSEEVLFSTPEARRLELSFVIACIAGPTGFIAGLGIADQLLPIGSSYPAFIAALVIAGVSAALGFAFCMIFLRKLAESVATAAHNRGKTTLFWSR